MVTEKIEKAPNNIYITIQYPNNNGFRNTSKHPEWLSRTKFKSPFKKNIQTRYFSWSQFIEFHLAHEKYVVWTASLSRRFADRKYSYTVRFRDSLFPTFKIFIYMKKIEKILWWKILLPCKGQSWILDVTLWSPDSRYWILNFVSGTWILDPHR